MSQPIMDYIRPYNKGGIKKRCIGMATYYTLFLPQNLPELLPLKNYSFNLFQNGC